MRSLNSICRARDEARYVSRSWERTSTVPDKSYPIQYTKPVESPDDIIGVCRPDTTTISGVRLVYITRKQYEEEQTK